MDIDANDPPGQDDQRSYAELGRSISDDLGGGNEAVRAVLKAMEKRLRLAVELRHGFADWYHWSRDSSAVLFADPEDYGRAASLLRRACAVPDAPAVLRTVFAGRNLVVRERTLRLEGRRFSFPVGTAEPSDGDRWTASVSTEGLLAATGSPYSEDGPSVIHSSSEAAAIRSLCGLAAKFFGSRPEKSADPAKSAIDSRPIGEDLSEDEVSILASDSGRNHP